MSRAITNKMSTPLIKTQGSVRRRVYILGIMSMVSPVAVGVIKIFPIVKTVLCGCVTQANEKVE